MVLGQGPIFHDRVPTILAKRAMAGRDTAATQVDVEPRSFATDNAMRSRLEGASSTYISVLDEICPQRACPLAPSGQVYYWDRLHTTDVGSAAIINRVSDRIFEGADPTASLDLVKARASGSLDR